MVAKKQTKPKKVDLFLVRKLRECNGGAARLRGQAKALDVWRMETKVGHGGKGANHLNGQRLGERFFD